jgi:hypothetical protein
MIFTRSDSRTVLTIILEYSGKRSVDYLVIEYPPVVSAEKVYNQRFGKIIISEVFDLSTEHLCRLNPNKSDVLGSPTLISFSYGRNPKVPINEIPSRLKEFIWDTIQNEKHIEIRIDDATDRDYSLCEKKYLEKTDDIFHLVGKKVNLNLIFEKKYSLIADQASAF